MSNTEHFHLAETQWTLYRGVVERLLRADMVSAGESCAECMHVWHCDYSLYCGLVVREEVGVA